VILLALLIPAQILAFLCAMDAFEDHLFPRPTTADDARPPADDIQTPSP
jgi:hypothetical protein